MINLRLEGGISRAENLGCPWWAKKPCPWKAWKKSENSCGHRFIDEAALQFPGKRLDPLFKIHSFQKESVMNLSIKKPKEIKKICTSPQGDN